MAALAAAVAAFVAFCLFRFLPRKSEAKKALHAFHVFWLQIQKPHVVPTTNNMKIRRRNTPVAGIDTSNGVHVAGEWSIGWWGLLLPPMTLFGRLPRGSLWRE